MKNSNTSIVLLAITAAMLLAACLFWNPNESGRSQAMVTIKDRDYNVVTSPLNAGGEALYITDIRTQQMAVFVYDVNTRSLQPKAIMPVGELFAP